MTDLDLDLDELKEEAASLGIEHHPNIGAAKLKERIDAHYEELDSKEPSAAVEVVDEEAADEDDQTDVGLDTVDKPAGEDDLKPQTSRHLPDGKRKLTMREFARWNAAEMRKTRIVTINDNDKRVNDKTTTALVNCTNDRFDLGTRLIPLNERVEVRVGHLKILEEIMIPQHVENRKTGMCEYTLRPRYSIQYHD